MGLGHLVGRTGRVLRSPRLAVALLSAFAAACLVGNLAPQTGTAGAEAVTAWQNAHPAPTRLLNLIDGFSLFTSRWFLILTGLLALCTLACTLDQFRRVRRADGSLRQTGEGLATRLLAAADELHLGIEPATAASRVAAEFRRLGLRVHTIRDQGAAAQPEESSVICLLGETTGLGRWSSPLFHLGLVLLFLTVIAGALTQWNTTLLLAEGGAFDPGQQIAHGATEPGGARPALAGRIPALALEEHLPRYQLKGYMSDSASRLRIGGRTELVSIGRPLNLNGLTLRQARRYGVLAEVVILPAGQAVPGGGLVRRPQDSPPPEFGGPWTRPDGSLQAGLVFLNQESAEEQRRPLYLPMLHGTVTFRLVQQAAAADYRLPLYQRFQLAVAFTPDEPAPDAAAPTAQPAREQLLRPGESLRIGEVRLAFPSLRYWTTFSLAAAPLTPLFFLLSWFCIGALGLGVFFPHRRVEAALWPAPQGSGTILRYQTTSGRGGNFFAARTRTALADLEEVQR